MKPNFKSRLITVADEGGPFYYLPDIRFADPNPAPQRISPPERKEVSRSIFNVFPILFALALLTGCAHVSTGRAVTAPTRDSITAAKAATHEAGTAAQRASGHVTEIGLHLDKIEYKGSRALDILNGVKHHQ